MHHRFITGRAGGKGRRETPEERNEGGRSEQSEEVKKKTPGLVVAVVAAVVEHVVSRASRPNYERDAARQEGCGTCTKNESVFQQNYSSAKQPSMLDFSTVQHVDTLYMYLRSQNPEGLF